MKLLFVTSRAQLTGVGGGATHTRAMLALLQSLGGVEIECMALTSPCSALPAGLRRLRALLLSLASDLPAKSHYVFVKEDAEKLVQRLDGGRFDAVVFNGGDLLALHAYVRPTIKQILVAHNVESEIIRAQIEKIAVPGIVKGLLRRDARKTRKCEVAGAQSMDAIVTISEADADWYREAAPLAKVATVSAAFTGPAYSGSRPSIAGPLHVAYLAKMSWWPNRLGAEWLLRDVLPHLPGERVRAHFFGPGSQAYDGAAPNLTGHGIVDSLDTVWRCAHFALCPIDSGSGVNVKLMEALFHGVPVLSTPHGARGLPAIDDAALAIVNKEDWVDFLSSDRAIELAQAKVRDATRKLFAHATQIATIEAVLKQI